MTHVLAIDQGTSGTKAVVVSDDAVLGLAEVPVRPSYLDGGVVEQDPRELLDSVLLAGRQAVAAAHETPCLALPSQRPLAERTGQYVEQFAIQAILPLRSTRCAQERMR